MVAIAAVLTHSWVKPSPVRVWSTPFLFIVFRIESFSFFFFLSRHFNSQPFNNSPTLDEVFIFLMRQNGTQVRQSWVRL
jgi:hypothetical protein